MITFERYFAQGNWQSHFAHIYRLARNECNIIVQQVSNAILIELKNEVMQVTEENWIKLANEFNYKWQFPNCLGAIDGKHIPLKKPKNTGSDYYNFKRFHSIILMAVVDANYKFISIDVGGKGSEGDAHLFSRTAFGRMLKQDDPILHFPPDAHVGSNNLPFFFVADDAFSLLKRIMKPFKPKQRQQLTAEETNFNFRLSRARHCVENAFGLLSQKWACIDSTFLCQPNAVKNIVAACCLLHNFMLNRNPNMYIPHIFEDSFQNGNFVQGQWRQINFVARPTQHFTQRNVPMAEGIRIREIIKDFVNSSVGRLNFQNRARRFTI